MKPFACVTSGKGSNVLVSDLPLPLPNGEIPSLINTNLYNNVYLRLDKYFILQQILFLALQRTEPGGNKNQDTGLKLSS